MIRYLKRHFKFHHDPKQDNLPVAAIPRNRTRKGPGTVGLARTLRSMGLREGVEIGTNQGDSALVWCGENSLLHLTCIDPYAPYRARPHQDALDDNYATACERLKSVNVTLRREFSLNAVTTFEDGSLDFVSIDGDHCFDEAVRDIIAWVPKVRKGGVVHVHDYTTMNHGGVMAAVDAYTRSHHIDPWYVTRELTPSAFWQKGAERL